MVTDDMVLSFFRKELPSRADMKLKEIPLELDDVLQEYAEADDLFIAINKFDEQFNVDVSAINLDNYYTWEIPCFLRKCFTKKHVIQTSKTLTVRIFVES